MFCQSYYSKLGKKNMEKAWWLIQAIKHKSVDSVASLKGIKSFPTLFPALENVTFLV